MAEWSIAAVLKTVVLRGTGGSNPSLSAKRLQIIDLQPLFFYHPFDYTQEKFPQPKSISQRNSYDTPNETIYFRILSLSNHEIIK